MLALWSSLQSSALQIDPIKTTVTANALHGMQVCVIHSAHSIHCGLQQVPGIKREVLSDLPNTNIVIHALPRNLFRATLYFIFLYIRSPPCQLVACRKNSKVSWLIDSIYGWLYGAVKIVTSLFPLFRLFHSVYIRSGHLSFVAVIYQSPGPLRGPGL